MRRSHAFDRFRFVRDEFEAARFAVADANRRLSEDPDTFKAAAAGGIDAAGLRRCARHLERTYVLRLFSAFEGIMLDYWQLGMGRRTKPQVVRVMARVADARGISPAHRTAADEVREFRNDIIHEGAEELRHTFADCRSRLGQFMSWLPEAWGPH